MAIIIFNGQPAVDPTVNYNGYQLPRDKVAYAPTPVDQTNNPSSLAIGGIFLPADTMVYIDGMKEIAKSTILDGVVVYEHVARKPYQLEFDIVIRELGAIQSPGTINPVLPGPFPQDQLVDFWDTVWLPDTIQGITNTYLNKLGILEIIIESINPATVRGSKNIPIHMIAYENVPGSSLIIS